MGDEYFILEDGEQKGPFTFKEITDNGLDLHTRVLSPLADTWQDACDLPEFYTYFEARGVNFPTEDNLASFWWRLGAYAIDYLILSFLLNFIFRILATFGITFHIQSYGDLLSLPVNEILLLQLITSLTLIIYNSIGEASTMKGSVGKKICKIVVVDADGMRLTYINALLRSTGKAISVMLLYLPFLSIFYSDHRQAMHDYIAKTYVVKL